MIQANLPIRLYSGRDLIKIRRVLGVDRALAQRKATWALLMHRTMFPPRTPVAVTLTVVRPWKLSDDAKLTRVEPIRLGICDWLRVEPDDPDVKWAVRQAKGDHAVRVSVECVNRSGVADIPAVAIRGRPALEIRA